MCASRLFRLAILLVMVAACGPTPDDSGGDVDGAAGISDPDASSTPSGADAARAADARPPLPGVGPGDACSCDSDCPAVDGHAGICVYGICMTEASASCASAGSAGECPQGSRCWGLEGHEGAICWPDCDAHDCDGSCDGDGSCVPTDSTDCDYACGSYCACSPGDCPMGEECVSGTCVAGTGDGPGAGPGPTCPGLPARDCTGSAGECGELVTFQPRTTSYYDDYPINGETAGNQYRSYLRRDLEMLIAYATARVECKAAGWDSGIGGALGLGDMSEANGAIPGTSVNAPGHPPNTHTNGYDIDLAYYQTGTPDNRLRPICAHTENGSDAYHCTAQPHLLDLWRTALFIGTLFESPRVRVVGVDGKAGPAISAAIDELCQNGWLSAEACGNVALGYEETNMGYGWFHHHHHHAHVSLKQVASSLTGQPGALPCKASGACAAPELPFKRHPRRFR